MTDLEVELLDHATQCARCAVDARRRNNPDEAKFEAEVAIGFINDMLAEFVETDEVHARVLEVMSIIAEAGFSVRTKLAFRQEDV